MRAAGALHRHRFLHHRQSRTERRGHLFGDGGPLRHGSDVLTEFIHVVTDPRRFAQPIEMAEARRLAEQWWTARDVDQVLPGDEAVRQFLAWLELHRIGRKRRLDILLAATYRSAKFNSLLTTNPPAFEVPGGFTCIVPRAPSPAP